jgi:hypothetical protein
VTNPFRYQHEKLGDAILDLMLPDITFERRLVAAMAEFLHAFHQTTPSGLALEHYLKIKEVMGDGPYEERAKTLTPTQRTEVVRRFWELDRAVSRDYYTYETRQ